MERDYPAPVRLPKHYVSPDHCRGVHAGLIELDRDTREIYRHVGRAVEGIRAHHEGWCDIRKRLPRPAGREGGRVYLTAILELVLIQPLAVRVARA